MRAPTLILGENVSGAAYQQIGTAIDYRIRYHFAITPSGGRSAAIGSAIVTRRDSPNANSVPWSAGDSGIADDVLLEGACVSGFFEALDQAVLEIAPHRRRPTEAEERTLARFCLVLAAFGAVRKAGARAWPPSFFGETLPDSAADMLALVPDDWVEDVAALAAAFSEGYSSWRGAEAVPNPTFTGSADVGGADADLIADGCLWEIKATKARSGEGIWLHQLLGYVLLDYEDEYAIDRVGLLLPRQNTRVSWPLTELIAAMSGRSDLELADLRERFRSVCEGVREEQEEEAAAAAVDRRDVPD